MVSVLRHLDYAQCLHLLVVVVQECPYGLQPKTVFSAVLLSAFTTEQHLGSALEELELIAVAEIEHYSDFFVYK